MIAANKHRSQLAGALRYLIGICAITDDIAQVINLVITGRGIQTRFQRLQVRVYVRENKVAQRSRGPLRIQATMSLPILTRAHAYKATRAQCPGEISRNGAAPAGRACFSTVASGTWRSVLSVGIAWMSPRV